MQPPSLQDAPLITKKEIKAAFLISRLLTISITILIRVDQAAAGFCLLNSLKNASIMPTAT
jgi:hypothetical protein